jgi:hypothetical protein
MVQEVASVCSTSDFDDLVPLAEAVEEAVEVWTTAIL